MRQGTEEHSLQNRKRLGKRLAKVLAVTVSVPETLEVPLIEASILADYEAWFFIASVLTNAVVGFLVAGLQGKSISLLATALVFSILFAVALIMALVKRHKLRRRRKTVTLRTR